MPVANISGKKPLEQSFRQSKPVSWQAYPKTPEHVIIWTKVLAPLVGLVFSAVADCISPSVGVLAPRSIKLAYKRLEMNLAIPSKQLTNVIYSSEPDAIKRVANELRQGRLAAFPTDTVYGAGALAFDADAVDRLYKVKQRKPNKPIPILVTGMAQLALVTREVNDLALQLIDKFWPGALTLILPRHPNLPDNVCAGGDTIAVRMPGHVLTLALLEEVGAPLATTSANMSGRTSPLDAHEVLLNLNGRIDLVLDAGPCPGGVDSTVVDTTGGVLRVLRETAIPARIIREALQI